MSEEKKDLRKLVTLRQKVCKQRGFARQLQEDGFGLTDELIKCLNCPANKNYVDATGCRHSSFDGEGEKVQEPGEYVEMGCLVCGDPEAGFKFIRNTNQGLLYRCLNLDCGSEQFYHQGEKNESK